MTQKKECQIKLDLSLLLLVMSYGQPYALELIYTFMICTSCILMIMHDML